jgi:uncharacterized membrane protein
MANFHVIAGASETPEFPIVRKIGPADLKDALRKGFADFWAMPSQVFFIGLIYPIAGVILAGFAFGQNMLPLLYPLASGFALVGPIVSIGLYELSRRREQGLPTDWKYAFEVLQSPAIGSIAALGVVLLVIFISWLLAAQALYQGLYGYRPVGSLPTFLYEALTTSRGWTLIILGNLIGFVFAAVVLAISVVSFPLLLDRDVGAAVAVRTSIRAVLTNPVPMALWGLIVAGLLALGFATLLVGLAIVVPVLGHATWHLYRRVVERDSPQVGRLIGAEGKEEADPEPIADPLRAAEEIEREEEKRGEVKPVDVVPEADDVVLPASAQLAAAPDEVAALKASRDQLIAERDEVQAQLAAAREEVAMLQRQLEEVQAKAPEAGSIRRSAPTQAKKARR